MIKSKLISTKNEIEVDNIVIMGSLDVYNKLLEIGISKGFSIAEISLKTGINKQSIYRYNSQYESQSKTSPKLSTILKLTTLFGYEIRLCKVKK
jgi:DNA-binding phage protein